METTKIEELLQKLMLEAYRINRDTEHSIFLEFMGHTNWLSLQIHIGGWRSGSSADIEETVLLNWTQQEVLEGLQQMLDILEKFKKEG